MYDEAERVEKGVKSVEDATTSFPSPYEIVISEDGSNDSTDHIADSVARRNPRVRHLH
jgi:glycosyltransferase involved in cell wall biosynthesis